MFTYEYQSPIGELTLADDGANLLGLWMRGQKYYGHTLEKDATRRRTPVFDAAAAWLDAYFGGGAPAMTLPLAPKGSEFQQQVWKLLLEIPYGKTTTYGGLARKLAARLGRASVSAQAVGGAVGRNQVSIIIPCHRVVGADGGLTGYAGGVEKKVWLLKLEGADFVTPLPVSHTVC